MAFIFISVINNDWTIIKNENLWRSSSINVIHGTTILANYFSHLGDRRRLQFFVTLPYVNFHTRTVPPLICKLVETGLRWYTNHKLFNPFIYSHRFCNLNAVNLSFQHREWKIRIKNHREQTIFLIWNFHWRLHEVEVAVPWLPVIQMSGHKWNLVAKSSTVLCSIQCSLCNSPGFRHRRIPCPAWRPGLNWKAELVGFLKKFSYLVDLTNAKKHHRKQHCELECHGFRNPWTQEGVYL